MNYYVTALQNDKSRLFVKSMGSNDKSLAQYAARTWKAEGYIVIEDQDQEP